MAGCGSDLTMGLTAGFVETIFKQSEAGFMVGFGSRTVSPRTA